MDSPQNAIPQSLLVHDGELDDLRAVFEGIGTPFIERRGELEPDDPSTGWDLIVSTPSRMLSLPGAPMRIVVSDQDSRTLRNSLHRAGIQVMVRRPVHPTALRGIILHALYRGPEKRRTQRVSIGAPVRLRAGLRQASGILTDLSLGGCRIIAHRTLKPGKTFTITIPAEVAPGGKAYTLRALALRNAPIDAEGRGTHSIHARLEPPGQRKLKLLKETILAYRGGPARLSESVPMPPSAAKPEAAPPRPAPAKSTEKPLAKSPEPHLDARQLEMEQRAVALDEEADRVLMGRDISVGGMRVSASPFLTVGCDVKLALHLSAEASGESPLTVAARVHRDDGERGVVLRFHQLSAAASSTLMKLMETMPVVAPGAVDDTGYVVSELLEVGSV